MASSTILVTGGAGYIGSHAVKRLLEEGHHVIVVDNLSRGHAQAVHALKPLADDTGLELGFVEGDILDTDTMTHLLTEHQVDAIMHFAALAYVGESVADPLRYYHNNTAGTVSLLRACQNAQEDDAYPGVQRFVFSSTCATYGEPTQEHIPIKETCPQSPINPYGWSKLYIEQVLRDFSRSTRDTSREFAFAALRYFNVAGSDPERRIGEDHTPESHLIPSVILAALGKRDAITIFGTDYPTDDGTCVRDYIHVEDLVDAHVHVLRALEPGDQRVYNLGIGTGYSVRQIIESVRRVTGRDFEIKEGQRRPGDPPELYADASKIREELGWSARWTDLDDIVRTAWDWFREHPDGYAR